MSEDFGALVPGFVKEVPLSGNCAWSSIGKPVLALRYLNLVKTFSISFLQWELLLVIQCWDPHLLYKISLFFCSSLCLSHLWINTKLISRNTFCLFVGTSSSGFPGRGPRNYWLWDVLISTEVFLGIHSPLLKATMTHLRQEISYHFLGPNHFTPINNNLYNIVWNLEWQFT